MTVTEDRNSLQYINHFTAPSMARGAEFIAKAAHRGYHPAERPELPAQVHYGHARYFTLVLPGAAEPGEYA